MEGNLPGGSMMDSPSYGVVEVQCSLDSHQHNQHSHPFRQTPQQQHQQGAGHHHPQPVHNLLSLPAAPNLDLQPSSPNFWTDPRSSSSGVKVCGSDEDEHSFNEDGIGGHIDDDKGKKGSPWHRMKWTDAMVKLLISIVAYIGEDVASEYNGGRKKLMILHKKGKWKYVSRVMAARGCYVSPQQCEDKFNDLNKRYKRLTDVLGRGTSCRVVENPVLLDAMDNLSEKAKEDVRKILSSKHLFYEDMCSYHNGNRLHLLDDPSLFQCLQSVLRERAGKDVDTSARDDNDEDEEDEDEGKDDGEEDDLHGEDGGLHCKRPKIQNCVAEGALWATPSNAPVELPGTFCPENMPSDVAEMQPDQVWVQKDWIKGRMLQLQEQKISIETQALELEAQHFKWQRFSRKKDRELDKLRLENERMKLLNERSLLELKRKELELGIGRSDASMSDIDHCLDRWQQGDERNNI